MKNRSHKYYTGDKDFSKYSNTKNIKNTDECLSAFMTKISS